MADNIDITEGAGKTVATDDVGGKQYQRIKLDLGIDGAAAPALAGAGVVATGVQRVTLASDDPAVTALQIMDDWDDANYCNVNLNVAGTDVAANAGVLSAQTIRVTIATDDECNNFLGTIDADTGNMVTALQLLDNAVDGNYLNCNLNIAGTDCVGNSGVLAAGVLRVTIATDDECNNFLGTIDADTGNMVTALQLIDDAIYIDDADWADNTSKHMLVGGVYQSTPHTITDGDVSPLEVDANGSLRTVIASGTVTTVSTVTSLTQMGGVAITMGEGALDGGCQRVTLATDDDGVAHLATIAGAVAATHMQCDIVAGTVTTCSTVTNLAQLGGTAITMDEGVHDAGCQRVTIATDDDGVAHLATIAGDTTNIETAIQIIDDWDATHDSAASADGPQMMAAYDATKPAVVEDGDAVRVLADEYGRLLAGVEKTAWHDTLDSADASAAGVAVKASAASTILVIQSYIISVDAEMWVHLVDEDDTVLTGKFWLKAGGGVAITLPDKAPIMMGVDKDLEVRTEGAGNVSVSVTGYTIPG